MSKLTFAFRRNMALAAVVSIATVAWNGLNSASAEEECGEYGTSVIFADSPAEASKLALKEEKLVFVLHVSGLFEDSDFT